MDRAIFLAALIAFSSGLSASPLETTWQINRAEKIGDFSGWKAVAQQRGLLPVTAAPPPPVALWVQFAGKLPPAYFHPKRAALKPGSAQ